MFPSGLFEASGDRKRSSKKAPDYRKPAELGWKTRMSVTSLSERQSNLLHFEARLGLESSLLRAG
jgi:hypothetical protein